MSFYFRRPAIRKKGRKIRYELADDLFERARDIISVLSYDFGHIRLEDISCIRSHGTSSRGTIARCHALNKVMQLSLKRKGFYVLEFLSERFDKLSEDEQTKVIIHELMHIPKTFGGGFKHHDFVSESRVEHFFRLYKSLKAQNNY